MIGYVTLGTNDLEKATAFYDKIAEVMGVPRMFEEESFIAWGKMDGPAGLALTKPFDGNPASVGNGTMVALQAESPAQVKAIYQTAMDNGGTDEGKPGFRPPDGFYAAYFRDLDGNKLNAFCFADPASSE